MPTYVFKCYKCKKEKERFYHMKKAPKFMKCKCRGVMKRLIGAGAGIIFRGEGWTGKFYKNNKPKEEKKNG